jgi:hypothetical protein
LLEVSWPTEALLAQIAVSKQSEHMPLNRQAVVMARLGVPIDRWVLADLDGPDRGTDRTGGGSHGSRPEAGQHPALHRQDDRPGAGFRARKNQDRLSLGGVARR